METRIFTATDEDLKAAAELIKTGMTVAFPTETVYGLGANALSENAVSEIFKAKGRPSDNPLIVHISDKNAVYELAEEISEKAELLMENFWPGPLTVILKKKAVIPDRVSAFLDTVGIRMPENETARRFIELCGVPVAAPSANISGKPSPTTFNHVYEDMNGRAAGIIKGEASSVGVESTVIDMSGDIPTVLRPGGISMEMLSEVLGEVRISSELEKDNVPKAPGMKYKHYSPKAQVYILRGSAKEAAEFIRKRGAIRKTAVLMFDEMNGMMPDNITVLSLGKIENASDAAHRLFDCLRECDSLDIEEVYAPEIPDDGLWRAVKNRLYKAAAGRVINAEDAKSVIFVCTGNTCRSPMAEVIFNVSGKNAVATSAGLFANEGEMASENACIATSELGLELKNHRAKQISGQMLENADLILTMTMSHKLSLTGFQNVYTLSEYAGEKGEIPDPYGGDLAIYRECAQSIKNLIEKMEL